VQHDVNIIVTLRSLVRVLFMNLIVDFLKVHNVAYFLFSQGIYPIFSPVKLQVVT
jgi:hypothetical protein